MLCPSCQRRNPEENRFCGHCGCDLNKYRTIYPREGYDERDLPPVSEVESDVPNASEAPNHTRAAAHDVESSDVPVRTAERHAEPPRETTRNYGSSTSILFNLDPRETPRSSEPEVTEPARSASAPPRCSEGIHGPSFLGLADSGEPDFLDDLDEPSSHTRRNWLLIALAVVIVLGVVQWRNIRDTGINFAGSMKLNLPGKKDAQSKPAETATDNHSENGTANNGKPEMVVNPENSGNADKAAQSSNAQSASTGSESDKGAQQNGAASQPTSTSKSSEEKGSATATNDNGAPAKSSTDKQTTRQAKNASDKSDDGSADNADDSATADVEKPSKTAGKPAPTRATHAAAKPAAASAGAEELARANETSSPETAAKWLWASTSKGNLDAPVRLADMYATGRGVSKDCEQATVLLRSSARRGNPRASARLGMYYATGQCVEQDRSQAWHWLSLANRGDPNSDWIRQYRERLWSQMTPGERARAGNGPMSDASE